MLTRAHVAPFLRVERGVAQLSYLADTDGRVVPLLDRLCRLVRRLGGAERDTVVEALRRQQRRVRDAARLAGIAKALLDACEFAPPEQAELAPEVREALFRARGMRWPPVPGDERIPYELAGARLGLSVGDVERLLYADRPGARVLVRAASLDGRALLARYNLELARAVLLDAERIRITARGGWRSIFRALKLARLMYVVRRVGRSYEIEITGPAAAFLVRPGRYGVRFARLVPSLAGARAWRVDAELRRGTDVIRFRVQGRPRPSAGTAPLGGVARRASHDSAWERSLASDFRRRVGSKRDEWHLSRETTPVVAGDELFLPDFTLRHDDGREALIELVGFWTPEYLEAKARKVAASHLANLILVVYRGLAVGGALDALTEAVGMERVVWFTRQPRAADVLRVAERHARR